MEALTFRLVPMGTNTPYLLMFLTMGRLIGGTIDCIVLGSREVGSWCDKGSLSNLFEHWTVSYRHKPTWTHQKSWRGLVENSRTDSPIPDCQAETRGWELLVLKQKRFGLLGGAPDRFIWNPRGEKTAFIFFTFHPQFASLLCRLQETALLVKTPETQCNLPSLKSPLPAIKKKWSNSPKGTRTNWKTCGFRVD